jgi:hypothetical protein
MVDLHVNLKDVDSIVRDSLEKLNDEYKNPTNPKLVEQVQNARSWR